MNKPIKILVISIAIFIFAVSALCIIAPNKELIKDDTDDIIPFDNSSLSREYVIDARISGINVDWQNGNVSIMPYEGEKITISENAQSPLKEKQHLKYELKDGILNVAYSKISSIALIKNYPKINCNIYVPAHMFDAFKAQIKVNGVSADIYVSDFSLDDLTISSVSGKIAVSNISANTGTFKTVSGDILIESTESNVIECTSTSGSIESYAKSKDFIMDSVSGKISLSPPSIFERADIKTVSGSITVMIPKNEGLKIDITKVSGDFQCDLEVSAQNGCYIYKNGKIPLNIKTTSGSIRLTTGK